MTIIVIIFKRAITTIHLELRLLTKLVRRQLLGVIYTATWSLRALSRTTDEKNEICMRGIETKSVCMRIE